MPNQVTRPGVRRAAKAEHAADAGLAAPQARAGDLRTSQLGSSRSEHSANPDRLGVNEWQDGLCRSLVQLASLGWSDGVGVGR